MDQAGQSDRFATKVLVAVAVDAAMTLSEGEVDDAAARRSGGW